MTGVQTCALPISGTVVRVAHLPSQEPTGEPQGVQGSRSGGNHAVLIQDCHLAAVPWKHSGLQVEPGVQEHHPAQGHLQRLQAQDDGVWLGERAGRTRAVVGALDCCAEESQKADDDDGSVGPSRAPGDPEVWLSSLLSSCFLSSSLLSSCLLSSSLLSSCLLSSSLLSSSLLSSSLLSSCLLSSSLLSSSLLSSSSLFLVVFPLSSPISS